jgi:hypothetical protein
MRATPASAIFGKQKGGSFVLPPFSKSFRVIPGRDEVANYDVQLHI